MPFVLWCRDTPINVIDNIQWDQHVDKLSTCIYHIVIMFTQLNRT